MRGTFLGTKALTRTWARVVSPWSASVLLLMALCNMASCKPRLLSGISTNDPIASPQLLSGFHQIEEGQWRWTKGAFAVLLQSPTGSESRGAELTIELTVPEVSIQRLGAMTLSCRANGSALPPETISTAGRREYLRPVAPSPAQSVRIDCDVDKVIPPDSVDIRERGIIAFGFALKTR